MRYLAPGSLKEALDILRREDDARCIAGGATLVAMMNADLVAVEVLVGLGRIAELSGITETDDEVRIGAMTRHAEIAASPVLTGALGVVRSAAGQIAHPAVRNMGTIGGSICHADPAADFPAALLAADATIEAASAEGTRQIPIGEFFEDYFETALREGEIVTAIRLPRGPAGARGHHVKFSRVDGDYATVSVSAVLVMAGATCSYARIALGSSGPVPIRVTAAEEALVGSPLDQAAIAEAARLLAEAADPVDDVRGTTEYRLMLIPRLLARALNTLKDGETASV